MESYVIQFFALPLPLLLAALAAILLLGERLGHWGWHALRGTDTEAPTDITMVLTSTFGLLSLLLAFTFGMAVNRYEDRRQLVIEEANAIGTAHIRTALATDPSGTQLRLALEDYARLRLAFGKTAGAERMAIMERAAAMRPGLARAALEASMNVRSAPMGPALLDSVNTVIDVGGERDATARTSVPYTVACLLVLLGFSAAVLLGAASTKKRRWPTFSNAFLLLLLAFAMTLIADLDRSTSGTITVSQYAMEELVEEFGTAPPPPPATEARP
jgi:hypothetical protein